MKSREEHLAWFTVLVVSLCFIAAHAQGYSGQGNLTQSSQRPESTPTSRDSKATEGAPTQSSATLPADILNHELKTIDDRVLKLADYSGKIIVVNLFASWCAPCRQNLWDLIKLKADYKPRDIEVIGRSYARKRSEHRLPPHIRSTARNQFLRGLGQRRLWRVAGEGSERTDPFTPDSRY